MSTTCTEAEQTEKYQHVASLLPWDQPLTDTSTSLSTGLQYLQVTDPEQFISLTCDEEVLLVCK